ncbi:MAG: prepilin-type N-terminal cleavage/methylation domain-containing protein [Candidatus Doudnabacteria bacterium]|jgi:prepilin-type N-terminal cleavage/methylation domain-containing protein
MNMLFQKNNSTGGFTLIEVLITIFIFSLISVAIVMTVSNLFSAATKQGGLLADQDQARKLIFQVTNELRNAAAGANGAYQLESAGNQQLIFYTNADPTTVTTERVRYYLQNGKIYKGITKYSGGTYNTSTENTILVQNNIASSTAPLFYYYEGDYTGSSTQSALVQPVSVADVKYIKVDVLILNKAGVKNQNYYSVNGGAAIRSVKNNLGQ